jgi:hypothetical protein
MGIGKPRRRVKNASLSSFCPPIASIRPSPSSTTRPFRGTRSKDAPAASSSP